MDDQICGNCFDAGYIQCSFKKGCWNIQETSLLDGDIERYDFDANPKFVKRNNGRPTVKLFGKNK